MSISRRSFLKTGSILAAGAMMPSLGRSNSLFNSSANDTVNVALIGCKNMGWANLSDFLLHKNVRCLALCDVDQNILATCSSQLESSFGQKAELYSDYRKVLGRKDIHAVIIGTPDHWHCLQFVDACAAGKDVYVEKPIANSIAECDAMVKAAKKYNTVVQVGQQQRSSKHWQQMIEYIRAGRLGKIGQVKVWGNFNYAALPSPVTDSAIPEGVDFETWLGPMPLLPFNQQRFHGTWRMFWNYGGGLMTDWGVHLLDMGLWGMDVKTMPEYTIASGGKFYFPEGAHQTFDSMEVTYGFKDFIMTWSNSAGVESGPYGKNYGVLFKGTNGTLVANRDDWEVFPEGNKIGKTSMKADYRDHKDHITNFLECMKTRNMQTACTIENGSLCAKYAQLGNISARMGGARLIYDDYSRTFNNPDADKYLKPDYRSPWVFPEL